MIFFIISFKALRVKDLNHLISYTTKTDLAQNVTNAMLEIS